jgi:hypothetical protein
MQEHERLARSTFDVMQTNAVYLKEFACGGIIVLRFLRQMTVDKR